MISLSEIIKENINEYIYKFIDSTKTDRNIFIANYLTRIDTGKVIGREEIMFTNSLSINRVLGEDLEFNEEIFKSFVTSITNEIYGALSLTISNIKITQDTTFNNVSLPHHPVLFSAIFYVDCK
jgi:hypothetical protein